MLYEIMDYFKENKLRAVLTVVFLVAAIALVVWSFADGKDDADAESEVQSGYLAEIGTGDDTADVLTDLQREVSKKTDWSDNLGLGILQANIWVNSTETATLEVSGNVITERLDASPTSKSFVVVDVYEEEDRSLQDDVVIETTSWFIDCMGADGSFFFIKLVRTGAGEDVDLVATSDSFLRRAYMRVAPTDNIEVVGVGEEAISLIDGDSEGLKFALCDYCSLNYPSTHVAVFSNVLQVDYDAGTVEMVFALDNNSRTQVTATYSRDTQTFSIGR